MSKALLKQLGLNARPNIAREALRDDVDASTINNGLVLRLAEQAHEANRVLCLSNGDASQVLWADTDKETKVSAIKGVLRILQDDSTTHEASHASWMENKLANGWTYGENKDEAAKTHPCLVPYDQLPLHEQLKDNLFVTIVETGLGISQNAESQRSHHGEPDMTDTDPEVAAVAAEAFALMTSLETLETASAVLNAAPDEEVNETNAALINTMVGSAIGEDQADRLMPSAESFSLGSKRVLAAYAREGIVDKIKEGAKAIWDKIVEMIQKFWNWITNNHKKIAEKIDKAEEKVEEKVKAAPHSEKQTEAKPVKAPFDPNKPISLTVTEKYKILFKNEKFSIADATVIADTLTGLCEAASKFLALSFNSSDTEYDGEVIIKNLKEAFSRYKDSAEGSSEITFNLYNCIAGNYFDVGAKRDNKNELTIFSIVRVSEFTHDLFDMPSTISVNHKQITDLMKLGRQVNDASSKEFDKIKSLQAKIKTFSQSTDYKRKEGSKSVMDYLRFLDNVIKGIYEPAARFSDCVASLAWQYGSDTDPIAE